MKGCGKKSRSEFCQQHLYLDSNKSQDFMNSFVAMVARKSRNKLLLSMPGMHSKEKKNQYQIPTSTSPI